jgi:glycosyltransferase involved in cell wall biosynthesis
MTGPVPTPLESLTIVVPAFDEERRLGATLAQVLAFTRAHVPNAEVLVVDDHSRDQTAAVAAAAGDVRVLRHDTNRGKGRALRTGVAAAQRAWCLFLDADHAIPIDHLPAFAAAAAHAPLVIGSKRAAGSRIEYSSWRWALGSVGQWLIRRFAACDVSDTQCGFKLVRTDVARRLFALQTIERFGYDFELLYLARRYGFAVTELPVACRDAGDGSVRLSTYMRTFAELSRLVRNRVFGRYPRQLPE